MNKLLHESRDAQWPLPANLFPGFDKIRIQPSVGVVLDTARGDLIGRGDFLISASLRFALIAAIVAGNLRWVHDTIGVLIGPRPGGDTTSGKPTPTGKAA